MVAPADLLVQLLSWGRFFALAEDSSGDERAGVDVFKGYGEVQQGHDPIGFVGGEVEAEDAVVRGELVGDLAEGGSGGDFGEHADFGGVRGAGVGGWHGLRIGLGCL